MLCSYWVETMLRIWMISQFKIKWPTWASCTPQSQFFSSIWRLFIAPRHLWGYLLWVQGGVQRRTSPGLAQPAGPWGFAFYHLRRSQELTHSCWLLFSHSVLAALCDPMDCSPARLLHPWDSPGKNTGGGCHALLQGIFPTKGLNWHLSVSYAGRQILPLAPPEKSKWNISQHKKGHLWQTHIICNSVNLKAFPLKSGIK